MPTKADEAQAFTVPGLVIVRTLTQAPTLVTRSTPAATAVVLEARADDADDTDEEGAGTEGDTTETDATDGEPDVLGSVEGHFSVFNTWYQINSWWEGDFLESVAPGAFKRTMSQRMGHIVSNFDHGFDPYIGDKILGPFTTLAEDDIGGAYAFDLLDATYARDLMPALKRGLYGSSFRFQVIQDSWNMEPDPSDHNPNGLPERTIREVRLYELGPVTYPASPSATAAMRCGTDRYYQNLRHRDPAQVDEISARIRELRTSAVSSPARRGTEPDPAEPATQEPTDPVVDEPIPADEPTRHSEGMTPAQRRERLYPTLKE